MPSVVICDRSSPAWESAHTGRAPLPLTSRRTSCRAPCSSVSSTPSTFPVSTNDVAIAPCGHLNIVSSVLPAGTVYGNRVAVYGHLFKVASGGA